MVSNRLQRVIDRHKPVLSENSCCFAERVFSKELETYVKRLQGCGFTHLGRVLDAGCGFGQWALSLAQLSERVEAIDAEWGRLALLRDLAQELDFSNVNVCQSGLEALCYRNESFGAVFCYGVLFLTRWRDSLREIARVLEPGGRLYVNANGIGWYKHLWYDAPNPTADYDPRRRAALVLYNTWRYEKGLSTEAGMDILIEPSQLEAELTKLGFTDLRRGPEGHVGCELGLQAAPAPFFSGSYLGDLGVYEVVAIKANTRC